jgi:ribosomal-protein-alanine N-acetyltransferase
MKLEEPIRTERLVLREFVESDADQVHEYGSDPEVVRYVPFGPNTPDATKAFIQRCLDSQVAEDRKSYDLAVVVQDENRIIGGIGIRRVDSHGDTGSCGFVFLTATIGEKVMRPRQHSRLFDSDLIR